MDKTREQLNQRALSILEHSAAGTEWKVHKYIAKIGHRYIYTPAQLAAAGVSKTYNTVKSAKQSVSDRYKNSKLGIRNAAKKAAKEKAIADKKAYEESEDGKIEIKARKMSKFQERSLAIFRNKGDNAKLLAARKQRVATELAFKNALDTYETIERPWLDKLVNRKIDAEYRKMFKNMKKYSTQELDAAVKKLNGETSSINTFLNNKEFQTKVNGKDVKAHIDDEVDTKLKTSALWAGTKDQVGGMIKDYKDLVDQRDKFLKDDDALMKAKANAIKDKASFKNLSKDQVNTKEKLDKASKAKDDAENKHKLALENYNDTSEKLRGAKSELDKYESQLMLLEKTLASSRKNASKQQAKVQDATMKLNDAMSKYGADSDKVKDARHELEKATDAYKSTQNYVDSYDIRLNSLNNDIKKAKTNYEALDKKCTELSKDVNAAVNLVKNSSKSYDSAVKAFNKADDDLKNLVNSVSSAKAFEYARQQEAETISKAVANMSNYAQLAQSANAIVQPLSDLEKKK